LEVHNNNINDIIIIITHRLLHLFYYLEVPCKGFKPRLRARGAAALPQQGRNEVGHRFLIRIPKGFVVGGVVIGGVGTARRMTELTRRGWHTGAETLARIRVGWPCSLASIPR
jgi:hypothetical protein